MLTNYIGSLILFTSFLTCQQSVHFVDIVSINVKKLSIESVYK